MAQVIKQLGRVLFVVVLVSMIAGNINAESVSPKIGIRGGAGTDVNGGLAYGAGINYMLSYSSGGLEIGIMLFGGNFEESTTEGIHTYDETTDLFIFSLMANYLIGYQSETPSTFFVLGIGLASINVEWKEESKTDSSLGTPLPGGGSMQDADGSTSGTVFNIGVGKSFSGNFDFRVEIPTIVTFSSVGESSSVIPTFILTAGIRF